MACRQPFRAGKPGGGDGRTPGERLIAAYEFAAATYGWPPAQVENELSDEQLVHYLAAATDRISRDAVNRIEAARMGYIFGRNQKAYSSWRRRVDASTHTKVGLTGEALEAAVRSLAATNPEYVVSDR